MDRERFWRIIEESRPAEHTQAEESRERIVEQLSELPADEIVKWDNIFGELLEEAYTSDLIGACCLINDGASDDTFYYFRCWLIGMGRSAYEAAIEDADSIADLISPDDFTESSIQSAAQDAWMAVASKPESELYEARIQREVLIGDDWDPEDPDEQRNRLPRLSQMHQ